MGELLKLPEIALHKVLDYSDYAEVESLRNCCRYLHNFTRRRRFNWKINPMRHEKFNSAIYLFWKYGKRRSGEAEHHQFYDVHGSLVCERNLQGLCTGEKTCGMSHQSIHIDDYDEWKKVEIYLDIDGYFTVINSLFGAKFLWQCERYLDELFRAHSIEVVIAQRKDPMSRANETVRKIVEIPTSVLTLHEYLSLMTLCEEDYRKAKSIHLHPLFLNKSKDRYMPKVNYDDQYLMDHLYIDKLKQYHEGIAVPYIKPKSRFYVTVPGIDEGTRRVGGEKDVHIHTFCHQGDRAVNLINNLFK